MASSDQEIEVKFCVRDLTALQARLRHLGAREIMPRTLEVNLRFDLPDGSLHRAQQVLRLRQSDSARLTYKGNSRVQDGVTMRQEIELVVSDFRSAQKLLEALGYQVYILYEKYRVIYELPALKDPRSSNSQVMIDELPFGNFIEIEAAQADEIHVLSSLLGLHWDARINESYLSLFEHLRSRIKLDFRDLSFTNFAGIPPVTPTALGITPAD